MSETSETSETTKRPKRWLRWLKRGIVLGLLLAVLLRVSAPYLVGPIAKSVVSGYGLELELEDVDLALHRGRASLRGLRVWDAESGEPVASLEHGRAELAFTPLLRGRVVVEELVAEGPELWVERDDEGLRLLRYVPEAEDEEEPEEEEEPSEVSLDLPFELRRLRVNGGRLVLLDSSQQPAIGHHVHYELSGDSLLAEEGLGEIALRASCPSLFDGASVDAILGEGDFQLELGVRGELRGFDLEACEPWLAELGLRTAAQRMDGEFGLRFGLNEHPSEPTQLVAELELSSCALRADEQEVLALDGALWSELVLGGEMLELGELELNGARTRVERTVEGELRALGLAVVPSAEAEADAAAASESAAGAESVAEAPEPASSAAPADPLELPALRWAGLSFRGGALQVVDAAVEPPVALTLSLDDLQLGTLDLVTQQSVPWALQGSLQPGTSQLSLGGELTPALEALALAFELDARALEFAPLAGWLHALELESDLERGDLSLALSLGVDDALGDPRIALAMEGVRFLDGETELMGMSALRARGLGVAEQGAGLIAEELSIENARFSVRREEDGRITAGGLRRRVPDLPPGEPLLLALEEAHFSLTGVAPGARAGLSAHARLQGLADELRLDGQLRLDRREMAGELDVEFAAEGLRYEALRPLLEESGIETALASGQLDGELSAAFALLEEEQRIELGLRAVHLREDERELARLDELAIENLRLSIEGVHIGSLQAAGAHAAVAREADGALAVAGLRFPKQVGGSSAARAVETLSLPLRPLMDALGAAARGASTPLAIDTLRLQDCGAAWADEAVAPAVAIAASVQAEVDGLVLGRTAPPARIELQANVPGVADVLRLSGSLNADPDAIALEANLGAEGLRLDEVRGYLPPGVESELQSARFAARVLGTLGPHEDGGQQFALEVNELEYAEGEQSWLAFDRASLAAERIDADENLLALSELALEGLALGAEMGEDGRLHALGFALGAAPGAQEPPPAEPLAPAEEPVVVAPIDEEFVEDELETEGEDEAVAEVADEEHAPMELAEELPRVTLAQLRLDVAEFAWVDRRRPDSPALSASLSLENLDELELLGADPEDLAPWRLRHTGGVAPIARSIAGEFEIAPWRSEPELTHDLLVEGVSGAELAQLIPGLEGMLDGSPLEDGSLEGHSRFVLLARRRGPLTLDLDAGFGFELDLEQLAMRPAPEAEPVAALEALRVRARHVQPELSQLLFESVEIERPLARIVHRGDQVEALGMLWSLPAEEPAVVEEPVVESEVEGSDGESEPLVAEAETPAPAPAPTPAEEPAPFEGEIAIDQLLVSGLDVVLTDASVEPPLPIPFDTLDVEVQGLTTRALTETLPVRFSAWMAAGEVPLPKRVEDESLLFGIASAAVGAIAGQEDESELEPRPAIGEMGAQGELVLAPVVEGQAKLSLSALELPAFRGFAHAAGVEIGDGVLDSTVRLRFEGEKGATVDANFVFDHLLVSEAPDGPISTYLKLPAPLDAVLFALRNEKGEHPISIGFRVAPDGIGMGAIVGAAIGAFGQLVTEAVARAPLRVTGELGGLFGVDLFGGGEEGERLPAEPVQLDFDLLSCTLDEAQCSALYELARAVLADDSLTVIVQHQLSEADLEAAQRLVNPNASDTRQLLAQLAERRTVLTSERARAASSVEVALSLGDLEGAELSASKLRSSESALGRLANAEDALYALLRSGAERRAGHRARQAALALSQLRLDAVRSALLLGGGPQLEERLDVRAPRASTGEDERGRILVVPRRRE